MRSGALRARIDIEGATDDVDDAGGVENLWPALFTDLPASVEEQVPGNSSEALHAGELVATATYKVSLRWFPGLEQVTAQHRVKWGDRLLNIVSGPYNVGGLNRTLLMVCQEGPIRV